MASYSKQMIEVAKQWLAVNPDPESPWLNVPGLDRLGHSAAADHAARNQKRYDRAAREIPGVAPLVEQVHQLQAEIDQIKNDLTAKKREIVERLNDAPTPGQGKHAADDVFRSDIGRWCLAWARDGHNVFDLGADFAAAMLLTDARELDISTVRLPFRGLLMLVPDGFARGIEGGHYTKIHVTEIPRADIRQLSAGGEILDVLKAYKAKGLSDGTIHAALTQAKEAAEAAEATAPTLVSPKASKASDPTDTAFHIYASDGTNVLDTLIERKGLSWDAFDALPDEVQDDVDRTARHTIRQIVFGTLAYITAVDRAVEERAPSGKKRDRSSTPVPRIHDVGRTIRLDPQLVRAARSGSREVALRLKHRHIVIGHYRNQPFGPRRSEVKRIWIAPFWRGPEDGAALVHTYLIDKSKRTSP